MRKNGLYLRLSIADGDLGKDNKDEREQKLLIKLKRISARGNNAEVKQDRDGNWIVYEVKKIKAVV